MAQGEPLDRDAPRLYSDLFPRRLHARAAAHHPSVDRREFQVGAVIAGDATPIAWPRAAGQFPQPGPWPDLGTEKQIRARQLGIFRAPDVMPSDIRIGISGAGVIHTDAENPDVDTRFRRASECGAFDYLDRTPPVGETELYIKASQKYGLPMY